MINTKAAFLVFLFLAFSLIIFIYFTQYQPPLQEKRPAFNSENTPSIKPGSTLKIMTWNVQFFAGNKNNNFFFSGGSDPWPSIETVNEKAQKIAAAIEKENPDIILLQEVDINAKRTHYIDQLTLLKQLLPVSYSSYTYAYYWKSPFIPHPAILGSVGMALVIISKYKISEATRYALPEKYKHDFFTQLYIFKRAILAATFPIEGKKQKLLIYNTHFSTFLKQYDIATMESQVNKAHDLLEETENKGSYALLGGDFNLIPGQKNYNELKDSNNPDHALFYPDREELAPLFKDFTGIPSQTDVQGNEYKKWFTQSSLQNKEKKLDKTIDYFFITKSLKVNEYYLLPQFIALSDHVPLIAIISLPQAH